MADVVDLMGDDVKDLGEIFVEQTSVNQQTDAQLTSDRLLELLQARPNPEGAAQPLFQALAALSATDTYRVFGVPVVAGAFVERPDLVFVPDLGENNLPSDRDHICHTEDRYLMYRGAASKVDVTHCVFWVPNGGPDVYRTVAGDQRLMLRGMNLMVELPAGAGYAALDDAVCPPPAAVAEALQGRYDVEELRVALEAMGRSLSRMRAADWNGLRERQRLHVSTLSPEVKEATSATVRDEKGRTGEVSPLETNAALAARLAAHRVPIVVMVTAPTRNNALPSDVYIGDETVIENMDSSSVEDKVAVVETKALLGTKRVLTDTVFAVCNALGFAIDQAAVTETMMKKEEQGLAKLGERVRQQEQRYIENRIDAATAALAARDDVLAQVIKADIVTVAVKVAVECMALVIVASALNKRPMVTRLNKRYSSLFTLSVIAGPPGTPSLLDYVAGCLASIKGIVSMDATLPVKLTAVEANRLLVPRIKYGFASPDMVRAIAVVSQVREVGDDAQDWGGLRPDPRDEEVKRISNTRRDDTGGSGSIHEVVHATEPIWDQLAVVVTEFGPVAIQGAKTLRVLSVPPSPVGSEVDRQEFDGLVADVRRAGAKTIASVLGQGTEGALLAMSESYIPTFLALIVAQPLQRWQMLALSSDAMAAITRVRHHADRSKLVTLTCPRPQRVDTKTFRENLAMLIGRFVLDLDAVAGLDALTALELVIRSLVKYEARDDDAKGLAVRREQVKDARQAVYQNMAPELRFLYQELKDAGIIDLARDADLAEPDQVDEEQSKYDLEADVSDDDE